MESRRSQHEHADFFERGLVLEQCARVEAECADMYRHLAAIHADSPQLASLWKKLAQEEEKHAEAFRMLGKEHGEGAIGERRDCSGAEAAQGRLEQLIELVKAATVPPAEAIRLALRVEAYLSQYHVNVAALCDDPQLQKLLKTMMNHDLEHSATLESALQRRCAAADGHPELHGKLRALIEEMKGCHLSLADTLKLELEFQSYLNEYYAACHETGDAVGIGELIVAARSNHVNLAWLLEKRLAMLHPQG